MAYNFPNSPSNGDTVTVNNVTYTYNSTSGAWKTTATSGSGGGASVTVSETAPASPTEGDLWFDPSVLKTFVYYNDGTANQWVQSNPTGGGGGASGGASVTVSETAPTSPSAGDLWWSSSEAVMYIYYTDTDSSQWVSTSTPGAAGATGATGPAGADGGAGVASVYATVNDLPLTGNSQGDMAHVTANNTLYFWNGSGWYKIALINTNPSISGVNSSYDLATDGTATTVTITATDPEGLPITYSIASDTSGNIATVSQGTGASSNVFTVTPSTLEANAGSFTLTFRASDGVNIATAPALFELAFRVVNSNYTTALITSVGSNNAVNNTFVDSSTNNHTLTVGGDATQSTYSPYRSGGYSTYFDGSGDYLQITNNSSLQMGTEPFTIELWMWLGAFQTGGGHEHLVSLGNYTDGIYVRCTSSSFNTWIAGTNTTYSTAPPQNEWAHVAFTRDSSSDCRFFLNGTQIGSTHTNSANIAQGGNTRIAAGIHAIEAFTGYMTDVRVVKGTAVYTSNFTPPTERLTAVTNTQLLTCHLPYIADSSTNDHTITIAGSTSTRPIGPYDTKKYSSGVHGGSMYFDGSGDYVGTSTDASLTMGNGDFTIEGWFYNSSTAQYQFIFDGRNGESNSADNIYLYTFNGTSLKLGFAGTHDAQVANISQNQWYYFALVRSGSGTNNVQVYLNGKSVYSLSSTQDFSSTTKMTIGSRFTLTNYFGGHISNFRVVKGTAVYTSDFTSPTAPLTAITNTSLLVSGTNAGIVDKAQRTENILLSGNTSSSTTQTKYLASSIYLDGTSDYIDLYSDNIANFGTGDFTIELWAYYNSIPSYVYLLETRNGTNSTTNCWSLSHNWHANTTNDRLQFAATSVGDLLTANTAMPTGQWVHIAVARNGTSLKMFFDGVEVASATNSYNFNQNQIPIRVGARFSTQYFFDGYMSDIRITKGLARYTTAFTPPAAALQG